MDVEEAGNNLSDSDVNFPFTPRALEQRSVHQSNVPAGTSSTRAFLLHQDIDASTINAISTIMPADVSVPFQ